MLRSVRATVRATVHATTRRMFPGPLVVLGILAPLLAGCTAILGTEPRVSAFYSATTVSPVPGAVETEPPASLAMSYRQVQACLGLQHVALREAAPPAEALHFFVTPDPTFLTAEGAGPYVALAWGHTVTFARGQMSERVLSHELAHLVSGTLGHLAPFWVRCDWFMPAVIFGG